MRSWILPIVGLVVLLGCSRSPEPQAAAAPAPVAASAPAENVEETIIQLEKEWVAAIVKKDTAALDRLLAADFVGTSATAHTFAKADAIEDIKAARYAVEKMDMDEVSVNVYGNTAVSFTSQEEKSKYEGRNTSGHYHFTNVWVKNNGQWQVVASHGTRYETATDSERTRAK